MAITIDGTTGITTPGLVNTGTESVVNITSTGNLNFGGTSQRITGDMSNATITNRLAFQSSTANANTTLTILPNGTSVASSIVLEGDSAQTNGSYVGVTLTAVGEARITSGVRGTGTYLPITFYTGGGEKLRLDTSGNLLIGTTSASVPSTTGFVSSANTFGFKNRIINGGMVIDQRNAGASVTPPIGSSFTLDRFNLVSSQASKFTVQQNAGAITPPVGFSNYLGITSLSAYSISSTDYFTLQHPIEGFNIADLGWGTVNASAITLSFWVRSSLTGTFGGALRNNAANRSYPFSYSIPIANTWTQISITVAGDTTGTWEITSNAGIRLDFGLGNGSTISGTAGTWAAGLYRSATGAVSVVGTSGATFYITGVQLEKGSTATSFDERAYGTELALCQRYYQYASSMNMPGLIKGTTDINRSLNIWFLSTMRASPTMSVTWNSGAQTGSDWVGTNGAHSYKTAGDTTTQLVVTAWTAAIEL